MSEKETYISSLRSFPSYLKIVLEQFVALLAFYPPQPASYTYETTRIHTVKGWTYLTYKMVLTEKALDLLLPRKYEKYCNVLDKRQKTGQLKPYFIHTSRGNSLFCVLISHSNISRRLKRAQNRSEML